MQFVRYLCILCLCFAILPLMAQARSYQIATGTSGIWLRNSNDYGFDLDISVNSYTLSEINSRGGLYEQLQMEGFGPGNRIGEASLPLLSRIVAVPVGAELSFRIIHQEEILILAQESGLRSQILPVQPPISKSADMASLVFAKDQSFYQRDSFSENPLFWVEEIGYLRGLRLFQFYYEPVRYNPAKGELKISVNSSIRVDFEHPDIAATEALLAKTASYEFDALYAKTIFNWNPNRASLVRHPSKMLILCPLAYVADMATYVNFKRKQGYVVDLVSVGAGGTLINNAGTIKNYLQNIWNSATSANPAPTYLLIVGDHGTTGNNITSNTGQTSSAHISDLTYVRLNGSDYLPEMYFGRFSVSNASELANVINKTLMFAQTSMPDLSYLGKTVMIAGVDANWATTHGNGAINYATTHYINSAHGIVSNNYLYPASGSSATQIRANAAEGRAYLNYTAHGSETSWADPSFTAAQMTALTNVNKPFVAVGNCCITNKFNHSSPCFGEAIIRAPNAGAAYIGGTNNTYWDEDYYWAVGFKNPQTAAHAYDPNKLGAFDAMFHAPANTADWASTTGETVFMGNMAVQQSGSSRRDYYWEIYSIMGDPSLMPYYGVPSVNNVSFPSAIMTNISSITVTAEPYTRVALSREGELKASGIVPANGTLILNFTPFNSAGTADLVFSASGKITRQETIQILPATGAYLLVEACEYRDNNNNLPDYNESGTLRVTFKNMGSSGATNISAILSCDNPAITITDATESIASLNAGASLTRNAAFAFSIANNVANGTVAGFTISMSSGGNTWEHSFSLSLNAPELSYGANITIYDPSGNNNGRLDPGESASLSILLQNTGAAASPAGIASLSCSHPGISISGSPLNITSIPASSASTLYYNISAASSMNIGEIVELLFGATAGAYSASKSEELSVGLIFEGFESGSFSGFPWVHEGNQSWTVVSSQSHSGSYSAKSGSISGNGSSSLKINRVLTAPGILRFWYRVSSEETYDKLNFYVDGVLKASYSGEVPWTQASFPLTAGNRELKWTYSKDYSVNVGDDCAWIDDIVFPPSTSPSSFAAPQNLYGIPANRKISLVWSAPASGSPVSYKIYRGGSYLATVNALSYEDNNLINGTAYSYYVTALYAGGESDPSNHINVIAGIPTEFIVGSGTAVTSDTSGAPINIYYRSLHGQSIYTVQELNAAGLVGPAEITALGFYVESAPAYALPGFLLRMRHTTESNVSSWQSAAGLQIYYDDTYMPAEGGYDLIPLNMPFMWNGVDNILVDTAFELVPEYSRSGTVRYTESANDYRFTRSDSQFQYQYFTGGSVTNIKPNIKLQVTPPQIDGAYITVNPGSLDFAEVAVGEQAELSFVIENQGNMEMNCRITTPQGFSVHPQRDIELDTQNTASFRIAANAQRTLLLRFTPSAAVSYNATMIINNNSENDPELGFPLYGSGYIPAQISVQPDSLSCRLGLNASASQSFSIVNSGGRPLDYSLVLQQATRSQQAAKSIAGSSLAIEPATYQPGTIIDYQVSVHNASTDTEWIKEVILQVPAGINIISVSNLVCSSGNLVPSISGSAISWYGTTSSGWGIIQGGQIATATLRLGIPASFAGIFHLSYTLNGDIYGNDPHSLSGNILLNMALDWLSFSPQSGSVAAGSSAEITVNYNSTALQPGSYFALIKVLSNAPAQPESEIAVELEVYDDSNHPPVINLPPYFSFLANGSLEIDLADYISDPDSDPLSISVRSTINPNVFYQLEGSLLRFTARENWIGSQNFIITISDGELSAVATLQIRVLPRLSAPVLQLEIVDAAPRLSWEAVPYAEYYEVYFAPAMDLPYSLLGTTTQNSYTPAGQYQKAFFKVKACYAEER